MIDVVELGVADAQRVLAAGEISTRQLTQAYLDRIATIDPMLNSVIELNPNALDDADRRDAERVSRKSRGPLHGIAVLLKDNIDVVGMVNSAGSLALANNRPPRDAFLVTRLRDAGCVILGKTNLSEWANFRAKRSTSGWSSRGGQTRNPYALDRNPAGSSAGTAVAIAASLATVGVGTETNGSIIGPSAVSGLVGLKPTVGLVSRAGIIPISITQDTAGPMGRSVADVAALLNVLVARDPTDPAAAALRNFDALDYTTFLKSDALVGRRLGLVRAALGFNADVDAAMDRSVDTLRRAGATVVDVKFSGYGTWRAAELTLLTYEFKDGINAYLRAAGSEHASLADLIAFNRAHRDTIMPWFGQELFEAAEATSSLLDQQYIEARDTVRRLAGEGLRATLANNGVDGLIVSSASPAWLTDPVLGDPSTGGGAGIAAMAGTPSVTIPMGDSHGLPLGLSLMGPAHSEPLLIGLAHAFEQATRARRSPRFLATLGATSEAADAHR